jgi:Flagellar transcriptional activator (FlhD)
MFLYGMFRLGLSHEVADTLTSLTMGEIVKLAASENPLYSFRFNDQAMLSALARNEDKIKHRVDARCVADGGCGGGAVSLMGSTQKTDKILR